MGEQIIDGVRPHEFDGIQEYDNALPTWWLWMFHASIAFAMGYLLWFHYWEGGPLGAAALPPPQAKPSIPEAGEEQLRSWSRDAQRIARGKSSFGTVCVACHGADATGLVGPNLRDRWWLHGSGMKDIVAVIRDGSANRLMPRQGGTSLAADEIIDLACYIVSLNRQGEKTGKPHDPARDKEAPITY